MNPEFEANVERDVDFSTRSTRNMKRPTMIEIDGSLRLCYVSFPLRPFLFH